MDWLQIVCDIIILIGGVCGAIITILKLAGKPVHFFRKRIEQEKEAEQEKLVEQVTTAVCKQITPELNTIKQQNKEQSETIQVLVTSTLDLMREQIIRIYKMHKEVRQLTKLERAFLDNLYKDYTREHGNSYIEMLYQWMCDWEVVPDEHDF